METTHLFIPTQLFIVTVLLTTQLIIALGKIVPLSQPVVYVLQRPVDYTKGL